MSGEGLLAAAPPFSDTTDGTLELSPVQERVLGLFAFLSSGRASDAAQVLDLTEDQVVDAAIELEKLGLVAANSPSRSTH